MEGLLMKNKKRIFFDMEFTGLHQNTTPISLGMITDDGDAFYAEFTDYNKSQIDSWLEDNVISNLLLSDGITSEVRTLLPDTTLVVGTVADVSAGMNYWLASLDSELEIWSDCLSYDWVLFNHILSGHALTIPDYIYYIPFDLSTAFKMKGIDPDITREKFADIPANYKVMKHNALFDAGIIRQCVRKLERTSNLEVLVEHGTFSEAAVIKNAVQQASKENVSVLTLIHKVNVCVYDAILPTLTELASLMSASTLYALNKLASHAEKDPRVARTIELMVEECASHKLDLRGSYLLSTDRMTPYMLDIQNNREVVLDSTGFLQLSNNPKYTHDVLRVVKPIKNLAEYITEQERPQ